MNKSVGFIGTGKMATAIINGLVNFKFDASFYGYDISKNNYSFLTKLGVKCCKTACELVEVCDVVVLSVKPQNVVEVLSEIKLNFKYEKTILVSIAAGIDENLIFKKLNENVKFVRVMPNTPFLINKGAVAICRGLNINDELFEFVKSLFKVGGVVVEVEPNQMDNIVAINGSSPAFIYLFAKGFIEFAKTKNIDYKLALKLFCASLEGSSQMMIQSKKTIDELISDVSSPNGTTIEGLNVLYKNEFVNIIKKTCEATAKKSVELSKMF